MNFDDIVQEIDSLPPLSDVVMQIMQMYAAGSDNIRTYDLVELIESDMILSVDILKMANSPIYGFSNKISSITQAVTLFGIMQIRSFVMHHAILEALQVDLVMYGIDNERFNDICNLQSALVTQWYSHIDLTQANHVSPLALIMESGKLIIAREVAKSDYTQQFYDGLQHCNDIKKYEKELLGISSYGVSSLLFKHWKLDPLHVEILNEKRIDDKELQHYRNILTVVRTAINVKEVLTKHSVLQSCVFVKKMGLDVDHFVKACVRVKTAYLKEQERKNAQKEHKA